MKFENIAQLPAPVLPAMESDGLIKVKDLVSPIAVYCTAQGIIKENDSFELMINGHHTGVIQIISEPWSQNRVEFSFDMRPDFFAEDGEYTIGYQWLASPGGSRSNSSTTTIRIDRTAPGSTLLAAIIFPHFNYGEVLSGVIPGYADMQVGDSIQTLCNGVAGPVHIVIAEDLTERPPHISFTREFLQGLDSENVTFTYQVSDRAGNASVMAQRVEMSMQR